MLMKRMRGLCSGEIWVCYAHETDEVIWGCFVRGEDGAGFANKKGSGWAAFGGLVLDAGEMFSIRMTLVRFDRRERGYI